MICFDSGDICVDLRISNTVPFQVRYCKEDSCICRQQASSLTFETANNYSSKITNLTALCIIESTKTVRYNINMHTSCLPTHPRMLVLHKKDGETDLFSINAYSTQLYPPHPFHTYMRDGISWRISRIAQMVPQMYWLKIRWGFLYGGRGGYVCVGSPGALIMNRKQVGGGTLFCGKCVKDVGGWGLCRTVPVMIAHPQHHQPDSPLSSR